MGRRDSCAEFNDGFDSGICAPKLGTLDLDRTIVLGGGFNILPKLLLFRPAESGGSGISSKSSRRLSSIGKSRASS